MGRDKSLEPRRALDPSRPPWQHLPCCNFLQNMCKLGNACPHLHDDTCVVHRCSRMEWCSLGHFGCALYTRELRLAHYAAKPLLDLITGTWTCLWQLSCGKSILKEIVIEPHSNSQGLRVLARSTLGQMDTLTVRYSAVRNCLLCRHYVLDAANSTADVLIWRDGRFLHTYSRWDRRLLSSFEHKLLTALFDKMSLTFAEAHECLDWTATVEPVLGSLLEYLARRPHLFWLHQGMVYVAPSLLQPMLTDRKAPPPAIHPPPLLL